MTKKETGQIVKLLTTFFRKTNDAGAGSMVDSWHEVFKDYEYADVRAAVVGFAKSDTREYPTMPGVGVIIQEIERQKRKRQSPAVYLFNRIIEGRPYGELPEDLRARITPERYEAYVRQDPEKLLASPGKVRAELRAIIGG